MDVRVDTLSNGVLLTQPATALVDPARQDAALRRAHWTLPGWILILVCESAALFYLWSSGGAARLRDWLRRRIRSEWILRFSFGASLALVARIASFLPAFYLYRVARTMQIDLELTRWWLVSWTIHTLLGMLVAGLIAAIVLGWVQRTHQWYIYTIVGILAGCVVWSYAAPYLALPGARAVTLSGPLAQRTHALLVRAGFPNVPVKVAHIRNSPVGEAAVLGFGSARTILLNDKLIAGGTPAEVAYAVAVQIEHVAHHDFLSIALIEGGIVIVFSAIAVVLADRIRLPARRRSALAAGNRRCAARADVYRRDSGSQRRAALVRVFRGSLRGSAYRRSGGRGAGARARHRSAHGRSLSGIDRRALPLYLTRTGARVAAINHVPSGCP